MNQNSAGSRIEEVSRTGKLSNQDFVYLFSRLMKDELYFRIANNMDVSSLKKYYGHLLTYDNEVIPLGALGYAERMFPVIECLKEMPDTAKVLDTGSGYGSESFMFALLGKDVIGAELVPERSELARSRIPFFQSVCDFPLRVQFVNANVFRYLQNSEPFDLIWTMEAISHIYPPESFLKLTFEKLNPGGRLVISDPNSLNPVAWARSIKIRGSIKHVPHRRFKDPETEIPVDYGQEQIFSPFRLKKLLSESGFRIVETHVSGFLCTSLLPQSIILSSNAFRILSKLQSIAKRIPAIRSLGSIYAIVAMKEH